MEDLDKFRAVLVERTEPVKRRSERLAKARTILLVLAALFLAGVLVVLVRDRMPALVGWVTTSLRHEVFASAGETGEKWQCGFWLHPMITVVSGIPRSGTSLMMQMMSAGECLY